MDESVVPELKPPLTYKEQLEKMKGRNLEVENEELAIHQLKMRNYYRLSAYSLHLKVVVDGKDVYLPGTTFEQITRLYDFDAQLRNMLLPLLEQIEIGFRTHIAYLLANKYKDPLSYLNSDNFVNATYHANFLSELEKEIGRSKEIFATHHKTKYRGQFPIWVAVELMSFGNVSKLFGNRKNEDKKESVDEQYSLPAEYVDSWLQSLAYVRNLCAHYSRLYNKTLKIKPRLFTGDKKKFSNENVFAAIFIIKRLTKHDTSWRTFLASLVALMEAYDDVINLQLIGFLKIGMIY